MLRQKLTRGERERTPTKSERDGFGREEVMARKQMGVRIGAEEFVCGVRLERTVCLPSRTRPGRRVGVDEVEERKGMDGMAEIELQCKVELERSMVLIDLWCAVDLGLKIWQ